MGKKGKRGGGKGGAFVGDRDMQHLAGEKGGCIVF